MSDAACEAGESIRVRGLVQGVGFRPFVHALAQRLQLVGTVLNDGEGVLIHVAGERGAIEALIATDPFALHGVADYAVHEFVPTMTAPGLEALAG